MPGSGKSTVGRQLARQLGWRFVDSDHEIERDIGSSIREYFDLHGESAFRDLEAQAIARLALLPATVLATGGGVVLREANRELLRQRSTVMYLRTTPDDLARRLRNDTHRPLLQGGGDAARRLRQLFQERDPLYRRAAHFVIETQRPSVHGLVNMVLMQVELAGLGRPSGDAAAQP